MQNSLIKNDSIVMESTYKPTDKSNFQFNISVSLTALIALFLTVYLNPNALQFSNSEKPAVLEETFKTFPGILIGKGVNVRAEPAMDSKVHNKIYQETIVDVRERSEEKAQITIQGIQYSDYWYKVEFIYTQSGKEFLGKGWVFGPFIKEIKNPNVA